MPTGSALLADTHALLWWQAGSPRLSATALTRLEATDRVLVSPITCWEVAMLVDRGRVSLDRPVAAWVTDLFSAERLVVAPLTPAIAVAAGTLPEFHGDPADRVIYATAAAEAIPLVTKDGRLCDYAERSGRVTIVW